MFILRGPFLLLVGCALLALGIVRLIRRRK
jgi:hypothetical protein